MTDKNMTSLTIRRPDDWHLHLRDGAMLQAVLPETARHFGRAIIMPNLVFCFSTLLTVRDMEREERSLWWGKSETGRMAEIGAD